MITFTVYGNAIAKREGRSRHVKTKDGREFTHHYQPGPVIAWTEAVRQAALPVAPQIPWEGPLTMTIILWWMRPKAGKKRDSWRDKKPDPDRLACPILDALEGIIYRRDAQVARLLIEKKYTDERPRVVVAVARLFPGDANSAAQQIPELTEAELLKALPPFPRTSDGQKPTPEQLRKIAEAIKKSASREGPKYEEEEYPDDGNREGGRHV
jgi:Holliday junction resolvase RusA-like endonuclease